MIKGFNVWTPWSEGEVKYQKWPQYKDYFHIPNPQDQYFEQYIVQLTSKSRKDILKTDKIASVRHHMDYFKLTMKKVKIF